VFICILSNHTYCRSHMDVKCILHFNFITMHKYFIYYYNGRIIVYHSAKCILFTVVTSSDLMFYWKESDDICGENLHFATAWPEIGISCPILQSLSSYKCTCFISVFAIITMWSFSHLWLITKIVARVTRRVPHVGQELLILPWF
jgi:hypothetical protein